MDKQQVILAALAAAGENATFTPVQVQKLFFLIDREASHLVDGPHFNFAAYDYGPFDRAVYDELDKLAFAGLVEIQSSGPYRKYLLTPKGYDAGVTWLQELPPKASSFVTRVAKWVRGLSFQQLVAAIYKRYPDMKVNSIFRG
jgi:uncharacterized phage-associated protein